MDLGQQIFELNGFNFVCFLQDVQSRPRISFITIQKATGEVYMMDLARTCRNNQRVLDLSKWNLHRRRLNETFKQLMQDSYDVKRAFVYERLASKHGSTELIEAIVYMTGNKIYMVQGSEKRTVFESDGSTELVKLHMI